MTFFNARKYILNSPDEADAMPSGKNLKALWSYLGNPQRNVKYLRLVGSNGKTVSAEMLMSVYKNSKFKIGTLTTTLRTDLRDNIVINGAPISYDSMAAYVDSIYKIINEHNKKNINATITLTKQEILLSVALLAFRDNKCDFCIIESDHNHTDPSVILPPPFFIAICGAIPSLNKNDLQSIRAYICHGIDEIVSSPQDQEAYKVISNTCAAVNCRLTIPKKAQLNILRTSLSGSEFVYKDKQYKIGLCGKFQITNALFVLEILERLCSKGYDLSYEEIYNGLRNTKISGKFEILSISPTIIADSTHSDVAISTVCESMSEFKSIIGTKIRLCLPAGLLVDQYKEVLQAQGYDICKTIIADYNDEYPDSEEYIKCKKVKDLIRTSLDNLKQDEILLISGPSTFTLNVRYELLSKLGF